ncbi:hypothetical protein [uncultured Aquabacterium sp.]|uniref:hypothetical protein n=1 Tax=Aquabacterium sp. TaxID=1872578 RepID=UPI0025FE9776|nr:hypothetical protein [uncultured Aquabacterium sp.]
MRASLSWGAGIRLSERQAFESEELFSGFRSVANRGVFHGCFKKRAHFKVFHETMKRTSETPPA